MVGRGRDRRPRRQRTARAGARAGGGPDARSGVRRPVQPRRLDRGGARRADRSGRTEGVGASAGGGARGAAPRRHAAAGTHRGSLAPAAASVQRDAVERSGCARAAGLSRRARGQPRPRHAARRRDDGARPRERGRRIRRRRPEAGHRRGSGPRAPHAGRRAGDGGDRELRAAGLRAGVDGAARRGRGKRARRSDQGGAGADRPRRRFHQGVCRLPLGARRRSAADLHPRRAAAHRGGRPQQRPRGGGACVDPGRHAPGDRGRRRDDRARRWRHAGDLEP